MQWKAGRVAPWKRKRKSNSTTMKLQKQRNYEKGLLLSALRKKMKKEKRIEQPKMRLRAGSATGRLLRRAGDALSFYLNTGSVALLLLLLFFGAAIMFCFVDFS